LFEESGLSFPSSSIEYTNAFKELKYLVYDTETSLIKKDSNVYVDIPEFVLGGTYARSFNVCTTDKTIMYSEVNSTAILGYIIVGHNLPFDMNVIGFIPDHETMIWDTALFHYLFTSQRDTFPSLEHTAKCWLGTSDNKESEVSEMIKAGIDPKDIPQEKLAEYCKTDVEITKDVFIKQFEAFMKASPVWQEMIINQMNWLKNVYCMSKVGLQLDEPRILTSIDAIDKELMTLEDKCTEYMREVYELFARSHLMPYAGRAFKLGFKVNPMSNKQIEHMLWGGKFNVFIYEEAGVYKTGSKAGSVKFKKKEIEINIPTILGSGADSKTIKEYISSGKAMAIKKNFLENLLELRDLTKTKTTYFEGYMSQADNHGIIHSEMKHVGTPTGRLSSTKPNIQNLKGDE
jgi:DNA polymerase I-like protein with 3'-5' exonuclease and polymerase domains